MFSKYYGKLKNIFERNDESIIEAEKQMVNRIQQIVGVRNVFGDKNIKNYTTGSILSVLVFCCTFVYMGTLSQLVYLVQVLPDKVLSFQAMNCFSSTCVPLSKFIFMLSSRVRLFQIMKMSEQGLASIPHSSAAHDQLTRTLHKARLVSWLVIFNQFFIHFLYLLIPFVMTLFSGDRYLPTTPGDPYGISSKYQSPSYEITFILTCIATAFSATNQTGYIVLFVTLLCHELGHFYAICATLNEVNILYTNDKQKSIKLIEDSKRVRVDKDAVDEQMKIEKLLVFCVKHHQFLLRLHAKISDLYKVIFGVHFLIMIIVLVTTLQTMNSWGVTNTILTGVTGIMPLIVYCFGGEMLITAGLKMSEALYSSGWEVMKVKHARVILLMLCLSQHPMYFTAGGLFVMNRETFGNVAQVVYKIYAVFN